MKDRTIFKIILAVAFCIILLIGLYILTNSFNKEYTIENAKIKQANIIKEINSSYNKYVKTNKEAKLYTLDNNKYEEIGTISPDVELELNEKKDDNEYFSIKGMDYYINYKNVQKINKISESNNTNYKKYIPFNENIITNSPTKFYKDGKVKYTINKSIEAKIIIKDTDKYYIEYNNELLYVTKDNVKEIKKSKNSNEKPRTNIRTLTYHTIYNTKTETCTNTVICHPIEQFREHMKYLSENNYLTLTMNELELYLDGKIQVPKKSIVITLDDGKYATNAIKIVEKYRVYATYFIITGRYDVPPKSEYMKFESHTDNLHNNYKCSGGNQGGELLCASEDKILKDLKTSQERLGGGSFAIAYPFFDFNERAIKLLRQAGFRLAFIGQYDTNGYSTPKTDRMKLRRKTIFSSDPLSTFVSYLK